MIGKAYSAESSLIWVRSQTLFFTGVKNYNGTSKVIQDVLHNSPLNNLFITPSMRPTCFELSK